MIVKGQARGRSAQLAAHLLRADENEHIRLYETCGTIAQTLREALSEMEAQGKAVNCKRPLYHASISPKAHTPLDDAQIRIAADVLEDALGLNNQPRAIVVHEKHGRAHVHVVWSRVDAERGRAISDAWNYRHHESAARALEALFGHRPVANSFAPRPRKRAAREYELRQEERAGTRTGAVTDEIAALWNGSSSAEEFRAKLEKAGYTLARDDRRVFVVIGRHGEVHSLARRIEGVTTSELRSRLGSIQPGRLPSVPDVRARGNAAAEKHPAIVPAFKRISVELTRPRRMRRIQGQTQVSPRVLREARAGLEAVVGISLVHGSSPPVRAPWVKNAVKYRSDRAVIIATYAARLAGLVKMAEPDQREAAIAMLLAE